MTIGISALFNFPIVIVLLALHIVLTQTFYRHFLAQGAQSMAVKTLSWFGLYVITLLMSALWFVFGEGNGAIEDLLVFHYYK